MDNLEKYIREHRAGFDTEEPGDGLWSRVEADLPIAGRRTINKSVLWRAAAVILVFAAGWSINDFLRNRETPVEILAEESSSPEITELVEAEAYYTSVIENRQAEVETYLKDNPDILIELKMEFQNLDSAYVLLKNDLQENLAPEQIIEAMIQNHRMKVEILNELLQQLKSEHPSHETKYDF